MAENRRNRRAREEIGAQAHERRCPRAISALLFSVFVAGFGSTSCAGALRGPRTLGAVGAMLAVAGAATWVVGEHMDDGRLPRAAGMSSVVGGVVALAIAGGWLATEISCRVDPDCREGEECREVPAPPGFQPYKQCVPR